MEGSASLDGRKEPIPRPRVRDEAGESQLEIYQAASSQRNLAGGEWVQKKIPHAGGLPEPAAALTASVPALEVATAPSSASTTSANKVKESS